ncbi:MAG TPA: peptidylprolyl isomerase [Actinomycetes bacterium]|nr:peptidylprolyl isomerase [Actinomycetes bacterium]
MSKQTRKRELDRLRARREAERQRARRRRALLTYGTLGLVVVVAAVAGGLWLTGNDDSPAGAAATTTAAGAATTAPAQFNDARAGAPTAPAQVACGGKIPPRVQHPTFSKPPTTKVDPDKTYLATLQTSCGGVTIRLDPKKAPETTANFMFLAGRHFYDSTWFHRIVPGGAAGIGVIQGGDPEGTGRGGPGYAIKDELPSSPAAYKKYSVAMANSGPNSGGSQFFIDFQDNSKGLRPDYSVFGEVVEGRDVVDKIAKVPLGGQTGDTPTQAVWIDKVTVKVS